MGGEIFELTKKFFQRLAETEEGKKLLLRQDQTIGFEVVGKDQVMDITKKYYYLKYSGPDVVGEERFVVDVKGGKVSFSDGEDVPVPSATREDLFKYTKVLAERQIYRDVYSGKVEPVDLLIPEAAQPCRMNIYPFLAKFYMVSWINHIFRMIAQQNRKVVYSLD
jgi:hypothetical protein